MPSAVILRAAKSAMRPRFEAPEQVNTIGLATPEQQPPWVFSSLMIGIPYGKTVVLAGEPVGPAASFKRSITA
ncbi:hypothetical protein JCM17478_29340 [Thermopirellula anaerolimosa]